VTRTLDEYNRKRDFNATPEPAAKPGRRKATQTLQFCVQKHDASHLHYDFRLELDGALKSWAIPKGPSLDPSVKRLAVHVEDHPLEYARFEGSIPEGHYGAGQVIVWDRGIWIPLGDPQQDYAKGKLKFELQGEKLSGIWNLVRTHMPGRKEQWFLIKHRDEAARPESEYVLVDEQPDSVLSERTLVPRDHAPASKPKPVKTPAKKRPSKAAQTLQGAQAAPLPEQLSPQLATLVEAAPEGDWRYEIKFDGYRVMARIEGDKVQLLTRNGHDWTARMPHQAKALAALKLQSAWLDGEMVVANDEGLPDFQLLQNAFEAKASESILYYLFDVPYLNGMDLRQVPLEQRRAALKAVLEANSSPLLRYSEDFIEAPQHILASACQMKLEGVIGKAAGSLYESKRSNRWIKLKCKQRQEFVIVGFTDPKGSRSAFGALLLGLHDADSGELRYAGKVGTGFNETTLRSIHSELQALEVSKPQLANPPTGSEARGVHWLKPELMAEVAYAEMTRQGIIRHSVFHGLRSDKPARQITHEQPAPAPAAGKSASKSAQDAKQPLVQDIRISHPQRIIDRSLGITKLEVVQYYERIAPWMLPDLKDRPVALVRTPEGLEGEQFFQKHATRLGLPHVTQLDRKYDPEHEPLLVVNSAQALVSAAQMGVIELHGWNAHTPQLEKPDRFILDLDPDPNLPWKRMIEATQLTLTLLDELGLQSFLKTSGGKGIHIVIPLMRRHSWDQVKGFAQGIAQYLARLMPKHFSAVSGPKNRVGKIFIDYLRNGRGATAVEPYSLRAREGLPVSVPIDRDELAQLKGANLWTLRNLFERLEEQGEDGPWSAMGQVRQSITAAMRTRMGQD
jgi:bifunctional non-homologous end joining protein LigD